MNSSDQTRKFTPEEIAMIKEEMTSVRGIIIDGTTEELPLQFNGLDINLRNYFFAQVFGQLCAVGYAHHLETGDQIEYDEIARMATHMTAAGLKEVTADD